MSSDLPTSFQERMKILLSRFPKKQDLAYLSGISRRTIVQYAAGESEPTREKLIAMAKAGNVSVAWLANGTLPMEPFEGEETESTFQKVCAALNLSPDALGVHTATGDSMAPTIHSGDVLLLDKTANRFTSDAIYLFQLNATTLIRRVQILSNGGIILKADNMDYEEERLSAEEAEAIKDIATVRWVSRRS